MYNGRSGRNPIDLMGPTHGGLVYLPAGAFDWWMLSAWQVVLACNK